MTEFDQYDHDKKMYQYHLRGADHFKKKLQISQRDIDRIIIKKQKLKSDKKLNKNF